jgi:hypothetical protein
MGESLIARLLQSRRNRAAQEALRRTAAVGCLVRFKYGCSGQRRQDRASRGEPP